MKGYSRHVNKCWPIQLSPDNTEIAIDEAEHLIDMCDEDEDERLTPDEIVENHDLWVDSDATEYGAQECSLPWIMVHNSLESNLD